MDGSVAGGTCALASLVHTFTDAPHGFLKNMERFAALQAAQGSDRGYDITAAELLDGYRRADKERSGGGGSGEEKEGESTFNPVRTPASSSSAASSAAPGARRRGEDVGMCARAGAKWGLGCMWVMDHVTLRCAEFFLK